MAISIRTSSSELAIRSISRPRADRQIAVPPTYWPDPGDNQAQVTVLPKRWITASVALHLAVLAAFLGLSSIHIHGAPLPAPAPTDLVRIVEAPKPAPQAAPKRIRSENRLS